MLSHLLFMATNNYDYFAICLCCLVFWGFFMSGVDICSWCHIIIGRDDSEHMVSIIMVSFCGLKNWYQICWVCTLICFIKYTFLYKDLVFLHLPCFSSWSGQVLEGYKILSFLSNDKLCASNLSPHCLVI